MWVKFSEIRAGFLYTGFFKIVKSVRDFPVQNKKSRTFVRELKTLLNTMTSILY